MTRHLVHCRLLPHGDVWGYRAPTIATPFADKAPTAKQSYTTTTNKSFKPVYEQHDPQVDGSDESRSPRRAYQWDATTRPGS